MIILEKAIQSITSRMGALKLEENRCTRNRSRLSKCSKCIDICPVDGITIENNRILIGDKCIECGLCAGACPTDSIMIQEPTEKNLYDHIEKRSKTDSDIILTCSKNIGLSKDVFKVPCLGSLSLEFLIGVAILPLNINIVFQDDICAKCEVKEGIQIYLEQVGKAKEIIQGLGIREFSIKNLDEIPKLKKKKPSKDLEIDEERRLFLKSIFQTTKNLPNAAIEELLGSRDTRRRGEGIVSNPMFKKHKILGKISKELMENNIEDREIKYYYKPSIEEGCKLCGACSFLCPMGALKLKEVDGKKSLYLINELCSGCGLCKDLCYYKAIVMENKNLQDFSKTEPIVIFQEVEEK